MKIGRIIPSPAIPASNANIQSPMTTTPADAKKRGACRDFEKEIELKERRARTGNVPIAKDSMISNPERKDSLVRAPTCIDWVNPQGRKNVEIQTRIGANAVHSNL